MHGNYLTTLPVRYPFTYRPGGLVYWLLQAMDAYGAYSIWAVTCGVDSVFGLYTMQMCGQFRILAHKFQSLKVSMDYSRDIEQCIRRHHMLMKSMDKLEKIFSILVLWLAITSALIMCTLVFQMSVVNNASRYRENPTSEEHWKYINWCMYCILEDAEDEEHS